jgi:hypothetical protein
MVAEVEAPTVAVVAAAPMAAVTDNASSSCVFRGPNHSSHGAAPARSSLVHLAPMSNARDADKLRRVVDDVHHAPVTDPDAALIFLAFQLFASSGPWCMAQSLLFWEDTRQRAVR